MWFFNTILLPGALFLLGLRHHRTANSFSPLPIGVHRKKKYPHNRWAPRTWRGGALECLTVQYRVQSVSGVFRTIDPPSPLHPASVSSPAPKAGCTHSLGGEEVHGGSIFQKTPDIGLASYSIIPLRMVLFCEFSCTICCLVCPTGDQHSLINGTKRSTTKMGSTRSGGRKKINKQLMSRLLVYLWITIQHLVKTVTFIGIDLSI